MTLKESIDQLDEQSRQWVYSLRPKYAEDLVRYLETYRTIDISNKTIESRKTVLKTIMLMSIKVTGCRMDVDIDSLVGDWDRILDAYPGFFSDPASTKYHGSYEGGLFDHSIAVYEAAIRCAGIYGLDVSTQPPVDPIACIFHDLCKVNSYKHVVKKDKDGNVKWSGYEYNDDNPCVISHGAESLRRLLNLGISLQEPWQMAINYHMGVFGASNEEMTRFSKITEKVPEVLLLHHADMIATKIYHI